MDKALIIVSLIILLIVLIYFLTKKDKQEEKVNVYEKITNAKLTESQNPGFRPTTNREIISLIP